MLFIKACTSAYPTVYKYLLQFKTIPSNIIIYKPHLNILMPLLFILIFHLQVTILYVGTFIAGIVGNVIVCMVIIRHSTMHTATNYYLFSLAVSDLIYLLFGE